MNTVPINGTFMSGISYLGDDTVEAVRQLIALEVNSHPDRLFIEVNEEVPANWYLNPKNWTALFFRLSYGSGTISLKQMETYLTSIIEPSGVEPREIDRDEWEEKPEWLRPLFDRKDSFKEWRILGANTFAIMPIPPVALPDMKSAQIPQINKGSLIEEIHPGKLHAIRTTEVDKDMESVPKILLTYFPAYTPTTPSNLANLRNNIVASRTRIEKLLNLEVPEEKSLKIMKARWYSAFNVKINAASSRFEQIFYGMTLSKDTPYVGYFTSKDIKTRHKFYVENPKNKVPFVSTQMWKAWTANTQPQRRIPTLLFYRGKANHAFDRIAVTSKDITITIIRDRGTTEKLEELQKSALEWLLTFDALIPFLESGDIQPDRWKLEESSIVINYKDGLDNLDTRRVQCLSDMFVHVADKDEFRFIRVSAKGFSPNEVTAFGILNQKNLDPNTNFVELLQNEMHISLTDAKQLYDRMSELEPDVDIKNVISEYPTFKFDRETISANVATSPERIVRYANLLRYVLTPLADTPELNEVCPRRLEAVAPALAETAPPTPTEYVQNDELDDIFAGGAPKKGETTKYNYLNNKLREFDDTLDKKYPSLCDKDKQVIAIPLDEIDRDYNYNDEPDEKKLKIKNAAGKEAIAICPPFWCTKDNIPITAEQFTNSGNKCPKCGGKLIDTVINSEFTVLSKAADAPYPVQHKTKNAPCCHKEPRVEKKLVPKAELKEEHYIKNTPTLPALRLGKIAPNFLGIATDYLKTTEGSRMLPNKTDMFRIGLGSRPSVTLPILLNIQKEIPSPKDAPEKVKLCSFFRSWNKSEGDGATLIDRMVSSIDSAYQKGELEQMHELEYVTSILECHVIRVAGDSIICGFWSGVIGAKSRTIVVDEHGSVIGTVKRLKEKDSKYDYDIDISKIPDLYNFLYNLDQHACNYNIPTFQTAVDELRAIGESEYEIINDPFNRAQALFVPSVAVFPILPVNMVPLAGINVRPGYDNIAETELPDSWNYLKTAKHPGYKIVNYLKNAEGKVSEALVASGFRVPIRPYEDTETDNINREVIQTIRKNKESTLLDGEPNAEDIRIAEDITYIEEAFQFLLFSLSKDVQKTEYEDLRAAIVQRSDRIVPELSDWLNKETHWDDVSQPTQFLNKVRKPCGQLTNAALCNKSSMCGWHDGSCKIEIKNTAVDREKMIRRLARALKDNVKQRNLVLDERISPFFSTILYLELPNEYITTAI
jgi:hypothetical protein